MCSKIGSGLIVGKFEWSEESGYCSCRCFRERGVKQIFFNRGKFFVHLALQAFLGFICFWLRCEWTVLIFTDFH